MRGQAINAQPLTEHAWVALENMQVRLLPASSADEPLAAPRLEGLFEAVQADFLTLFRELATGQAAPASMAGRGAAIRRALSVLRKHTRPGQSYTGASFELQVSEQGDPVYTIAIRSADQRSGRVLELGATTGGGADGLYPLPFKTASLQDIDAAGRVYVRSITRDQDGGIFVARTTVRPGGYVQRPTDFGVLVRPDGTRVWELASVQPPSARSSRSEGLALGPFSASCDHITTGCFEESTATNLSASTHLTCSLDKVPPPDSRIRQWPCPQ